MNRPLRLASAGETHPGKIRDGNEDRFACVDSLGLFLVADGIGGRPAGEVAAALAIERVRAFFEDPGITAPDSAESMLSCLVDAVQHASRSIHQQADLNADQKGMGTTLVAVLARGSNVCIAHAGDSRVYRFREGRLDLLTEDHTLLNECIWKGMPVDQAEAMPNRHLLTRALGIYDSIEVSARLVHAQPGDVMLLCTDGIGSVLDRRTIVGLLAEAGDLKETARRFILRANDAGGPDNATVVVLRWVSAE